MYCAAVILVVMTASRMRWVSHITRMGQCKTHKQFWFEVLMVRDVAGDLSVGGRMILKCEMRDWSREVRLD